MKRFFTLLSLVLYLSLSSSAQTLANAMPMDSINGMTIYTCDERFMDSGGHYEDC